MLIALDDKKRRMKAYEKGMHGICPDCDGEVFSRAGAINAKHWAHKTSCTVIDSWNKKGSKESNWHLIMKDIVEDLNGEEFFEFDTEVEKWFGDKEHRADATINDGSIIVEFQKSILHPDEIIERELFYGSKLVWILHEDAISLSKFTTQPTFTWRRRGVIDVFDKTQHFTTAYLGTKTRANGTKVGLKGDYWMMYNFYRWLILNFNGSILEYGMVKKQIRIEALLEMENDIYFENKSNIRSKYDILREKDEAFKRREEEAARRNLNTNNVDEIKIEMDSWEWNIRNDVVKAFGADVDNRMLDRAVVNHKHNDLEWDELKNEYANEEYIMEIELEGKKSKIDDRYSILRDELNKGEASELMEQKNIHEDKVERIKKS